MNKLEQLVHKLCPNGVEFKSLGEIATISRGGNFQKKDYCEVGIPCIHYGQIYTQYGLFAESAFSYIDAEVAKKQKMAEPNDIIMAVTSENIEDVCKCVAWLGKDKIAVSGHTAIIHHTQNPKYLAYYFHSNMFFQQKKKIAHGTKVIEVTPDKLKGISIPVPPLPVQAEIVRILDNFTELNAELNEKLAAELAARKKQYEYYRSNILSFDSSTPKMQLGDIGSVCMCKRILKSQTNTIGGVPFYKIGTFGKEPDAFISTETFEEYRTKYNFPKKGDILISAAGTIGRTVVYDGKPAYFQDSNIVWIDNDETQVLNSYLRYCYELKPWNVSTGGTIARLYNDNIAKAQIPVPSLEEQTRIVSILDRFDKLCNDISEGLPAEIAARQKQYEYYRDKLLTFKEAMLDMSMRVQLLPAPLIIKNFVEGDSDCNYEKYLLELVNTAKCFQIKSPCGFSKPISESNGECDALGDNNYNLDFKLIASKTALQARSILSSQISKMADGVISYSGSKCPGASVQATRIFAALRGRSLSDLIEMRKNQPKKQGIENDICTFLKTLEFEKDLLLFFPYEFTFDTPHTFEEKIKSSIEGLNNDFKTSFIYRNQCSPQYETFFVYLCDDRFVICNVENCKLHYIEYVDTKSVSTYKHIVDAYID